MTNTDTSVNAITAYKGHVQAMAFARKGGAAFSALLYGIAKRKEEEGKGPIETMLFLETHFSDEEGHNIPVVGSKKEDSGNKPYDRYTTEVKTADGTRKVPGSWFTDVVKSTEAWAVLNQRREHVKQAQGEGVPADIIAMKPGERAMEKKRIDAFITNMRTALTKGAMLLHQVEAVNTMNPNRVKARLPIMAQKDDAGKEVEVVVGNLIRVYDPTDLSDDAEPEVVTVGSFLQWDPAKAAKDPDGGTIASLKATASKGPKKNKTTLAGTGANYVAPRNVEETFTLFNCLATGLDQESDHGEKIYAALLTKASGKDKDAREARISIGKVALALDSLWTVIRPAYMLDVEAEAKANVAAIAKAG